MELIGALVVFVVLAVVWGGFGLLAVLGIRLLRAPRPAPGVRRPPPDDWTDDDEIAARHHL